MMKQIHVAVGVIERDGKIFITRRPEHLHQGGKWEFPGGKVEQGESLFEALQRELEEELGIKSLRSEALVTVQHDYGDKRVKLETHWVRDFEGEPKGLEGQEGLWVPIDKLSDFEFPEANLAILNAVQASG